MHLHARATFARPTAHHFTGVTVNIRHTGVNEKTRLLNVVTFQGQQQRVRKRLILSIRVHEFRQSPVWERVDEERKSKHFIFLKKRL